MIQDKHPILSICEGIGFTAMAILFIMQDWTPAGTTIGTLIDGSGVHPNTVFTVYTDGQLVAIGLAALLLILGPTIFTIGILTLKYKMRHRIEAT